MDRAIESKPISGVRPSQGTLPRAGKLPQLSEVLSGKSVDPWSLPAFKTFLERNHCSEVMLFILDATAYANFFQDSATARYARRRSCLPEAISSFSRILETYILPDSGREINIPGSIRDSLLLYQTEYLPPPPSVLQPAVDLMNELLNGVFLQFIEDTRSQVTKLKTVSPSNPVTTTTTLEWDHDTGQLHSVAHHDGGHRFYQRAQDRAHTLFGSSRIYRVIKVRNRPSPIDTEADRISR